MNKAMHALQFKNKVALALAHSQPDMLAPARGEGILDGKAPKGWNQPTQTNPSTPSGWSTHPQRLDGGDGVLEVVGRLAQHVRVPALLHNVPVRLVCNRDSRGYDNRVHVHDKGSAAWAAMQRIARRSMAQRSMAGHGTALTAVHGDAHAAAAGRNLGVAALLLQGQARAGGQRSALCAEV